MARFNEAEDACFLPKEGDGGVTAVQHVVAVPSVLHKHGGRDGVRKCATQGNGDCCARQGGGRNVTSEPAEGDDVEY